ncbi:MAG: Lipopolysaccharide assembly protein B [Phycisphaerae bacterium]|nr:Lipopolysaccharide assembly protein B [Phycisphaerae bacterium]
MGLERITHQHRKERYRQAMRAFDGRDYSLAGERFAELAGDSDLVGHLSRYYAAECFLRLGLECMTQSDYGSAAGAFHLAIKFNPRSDSLCRYLACCFARLQQYDRAAHHSDREVSLSPDAEAPRIRLALAQWRDGQPERALQTLREGLALQPDQSNCQFQLGVLHAAREEYADALAAFNSVLQQQPEQVDVLLHAALCYGATQQADRAEQLLTTAQRLRPQDARIALYLALARQALDQPAVLPTLRLSVPTASPAVDIAAVEELTELVSNEPEVVDAFIHLPPEGTDENIYELLAAVVERAMNHQPYRAELYFHQARLYARMGRTEQAIASCEKAVEIDPQMVQALITLGKLYRETDRNADATQRLEQVLAMGYQYADVYFHLGCAYRDQGQTERARRFLEAALRVNSRYTAAQEALQTLAA